MKVYYNEHGDLIEDPAAALAGNVYVYSTRRGDFVFPVEQQLPVIAAEDPGGVADVPAEE